LSEGQLQVLNARLYGQLLEVREQQLEDLLTGVDDVLLTVRDGATQADASAAGEADVRGLPEVVGTLLLLSGVLDVLTRLRRFRWGVEARC
jgi:uncharacterized membrane protein SirB2